MPNFDGTGPMGMGSMTGGGRGNCNPQYVSNPNVLKGVGKGGFPYGGGRGRTFGGGHGYNWRKIAASQNQSQPIQSVSKTEENEALIQQIEMLKKQINTIQEKLNELNK